ncbi:MAG: FkbM family methyltransferase [Pseudomonadota bacterium]
MTVSNPDAWRPVSFVGRLFKSYLLMPEHPAKVRVETLLGKALFGSGITLQGHGARLQLDANDWITRMLLEHGNYEQQSLALAKRLLNRGGTFLDIGANFGLYTCILGTLPNVGCIAVEPSAEMFLRLKRNLALNASIRVMTAHLALSADTMLVSFGSPDAGNKGMSRIMASRGEDLIACISLNRLLDHIKPGPVTLMKIDVEGHEMDILRAFDFAGPYRPANIIAEYVPAHDAARLSFADYCEFFRQQGYELLTVTGETIREGAIPEHNIWLKDRQVS